VHYHQKVEDEKLTLERQPDFNLVACFTVLDPLKYGYIDFDQLYRFMKKVNPQVN